MSEKGHWSVASNVFAVVAVLALVVGGVAAWRQASDVGTGEATRLGGETVGESEHQVQYDIQAIGTANESVTIQYTSADGSNGEASAPGVAPFWTQTIATERGMYGVNLNAQGSSSDFAFKLFCRISVDGIEAAKGSGPGFCSAQFDFSRFADLKAHATPTPSATPTTPRPVPTTPASCRYVTAGEMTDVVTRAAGVVKPVISTWGDKNGCHQVIDQDTSAVTFRLEKKGQQGGFPATRVRGIKERAWYMSYGAQMGELRVTLPNRDVFVVSVFFLGLRADAEQVAIGTYQAARPRLLKK